MKKLVEKIMQETPVEVLEKERDYNNISVEEAVLLKKETIRMTVREFANKFEGDQLSILYRNGYQRGFIRTSDIDKRCVPITTDQSIVFDILDAPEDGLVCYNLNEYR